ncbi:MAG TPA: Qat anti-phage system QueC-like protein QatC [Pirellulales bacterium]|nr:Qat anti-phage system QueC-like protein QatC [Pirellulales bacterium]
MKLARFVGKNGSTDTTYTATLTDEGVNVIDTTEPEGNVSVHFLRNGKRAHASLEKGLRDFFDLGICVYIADELLDRERGHDGWTRSFEFVMPVYEPARWREHERQLVRLLGHLSGDRYRFEWLPRRNLTGYGERRRGVPTGYDAVCLFSGGVDSLLGAYELLNAGKRVILCGHYADGISSKAQMDLFKMLRAQFGKSVLLIQCYIARTLRPTVNYALSEKCEESHRPRSFLFLATAVAVAKLACVKEIYIPENGLIALNAPLGLSRVGTLSTRTVHPRFLVDFLSLLHGLGIYEGSLTNPFLLQSKTDMVRGASRESYPMLLRSVSCAHTGSIRWTGKRGVRHCGYCIPCLYRRAAFMEVGIDNAADYYCDVFRDLTKLSETEQCDFRFLARFAANVGRMSAAAREALVLRQGLFEPAECATIGGQDIETLLPFADMIESWASDFLEKVDMTASESTRCAIGRR